MFYTNNRFNNMADIDVEPNMAYAHENGALVAMIEGYENERALFEAAIYTDIQESTLISEGASEEEIVSLQENAVTSFFTKIKEFFKKLWEKVKAVFHGFIARFDSWFKSGDKLVKKYRAELMKKSLKGVDFSFDAPKDWGKTIVEPNSSVTVRISGKEVSDPSEALKNFEHDEVVCHYLGILSGVKCSDSADFDEEYHDSLFDGEEDIDGDKLKGPVLDFLEKKNAIKDAEKAAKGLDKAIANILKEISKEEKEFNKAITNKTAGKVSTVISAGTKDDTTAKSVNQDEYTADDMKDTKKTTMGGATLSLMRKRANAYQAAITKFTSTSLKELKDLTSRSKAVLARMVAAQEESTFLDALEDAVLYETDMELRGDYKVVDAE